ncbi:MAG TPA: S8 family serine peptidase [Verrucomicrobiae bacterium]
MRFSARTWSLLSVLLFVAAAFFWLKGNEIEARKRSAPKAVATTNPPTSALDLFSTRSGIAQLAKLSTAAEAFSPAEITADSIQPGGEVEPEAIRKRYPYRLRNTQKTLKELVRDDRAVLLANALIDTSGEAPEIPEHLRAEGDPGSYIVQSTGAPDSDFRARLSEAGAEIISYVPNNAYFVKLNKSGADSLIAAQGISSVLPYQPYYKLDPALLGFAVNQEPLPEGAMLRVTFLPDTENLFEEVARLNVQVLAQEKSPFGPQLILRPGTDDLVSLARLPSVQGIERSSPRMPASDISRVVMGVATNGGATNYLGLTGQGVLVNINDTGIQPNHPALRDTTIYLPAPPLGGLMTANDDPDGHGTFVASLIAGSGNESPSTYRTNSIEGTNGSPSTNVIVQVLPGSDTNATLRGMAPAADLLALPLDPTGSASDVNIHLLDSWLIESAAQSNYVTLRRTNSLISNNSWTYGIETYDSSAARFDQAVRDALPAAPHEQPLLFVFAAGNAGFGDEDGLGGRFDSIESPATAKNVITVGALETPRFITNVFYTLTNYFYTTNVDGTLSTNEEVEFIYPFANSTDSEDEVASFSSRGNVGIGIEGDIGRFKPDVVAPGTMLISARSGGWDFNGFDTNDANFGELYFNLHTNLQPYRFDSGSTFAAANVSGMLALIQEYFLGKAPTTARRNLSPALMKALVINGARSLSRSYDLAAQSAANYQGWGLPNLPNSLSSYSTNDHSSIDARKHRLRFVEQSPDNALATGQSRTWNITLNSNAVSFPLRTTLVWTDPPGNPAVAVKLVNDLDLVITNLDTGFVYCGNNIPVGSDETVPVDPAFDPIITDVINNVEQVTISDPSLLGDRFSVTVRARRVNVNAVPGYLAATGSRNDVVQDFALVISSELGANPEMNDPDPSNPNGYLPNVNVFDLFERVALVNVEPRAALTRITNGLPLLDERVGANPTLLSTNGAVGQWNFYIFTNINETNALVTTRAGSNVAFVTFNPPNLSKPRSIEADIDLYVSTDPQLTNLSANAIATAWKSTLAGGTESVIFTNAAIGTVYYLGVKAEDQHGAEFSLIGVSSDEPFEEERNGRIYLNGVPFEAAVLDGNPRKPTAGTMLAIGLSSRRVANAQVSVTTFHENFPDLVGVLSKQQQRVILNNHNLGATNFGINAFTYNDNIMFDQVGTIQSDGPGSLNEFAGYKLVGPWFLEMIDDAPSHTGRVQRFEIVIDPLRESIPIDGPISGTVEGGRIVYYPLDVPFGVTNVNFDFTVNGQLEFYWREGLLPTTNEFDTNIVINPPGARFDLSVVGGRTYYMGLRNPGSGIVSFTLTVTPSYADANFNRFFSRRLLEDVFDVATTNSIIDVREDKLVGDVKVGISMKHPRSSDIALTLVSPQGSRILLSENRGYTNAGGIGGTITLTNRSTNGSITVITQGNYVIFTDRTNLANTQVKYANPGSSNSLGAVGIAFASGFEGSTQVGNYTPNQLLMDGWRVQNGQVSIINSPSLAHTGDTLLSLGIGGINRQFAISQGRSYRLRFYAKAGERLDFYSTGVDNSRFPLAPGLVDPHYQRFPGSMFVLHTNEPPFFPPTSWTPNTNGLSQWIAPYPVVPTNDATGIFVVRTYINLYENNPATYFRQFKWAADDAGPEIRINGRFFTAWPAAAASNFNAAPFNFLPNPVLELGINTVDFVLNDAGGAEGLRVQVDPSFTPLTNTANPTASSTIGGVSTPISAGPNWQLNEVVFVPGSSTESLSFNRGNGEVWIDTVSVESSGDVFLQPEEPFELIEGERAMGEWRLEVRDTRTGAVLPTSEVLNWSLEIAFVDTRNPADTMVAGDSLGTITLEDDQVHYLILDPCAGATFARLELEGIGNFDKLLIFADHSGFPTGNPETDDFIPIPNSQNPGQANGRATLDLSTLLPAPARLTGKPIYVAIINQFLESTNSYRLTFQADGSCSSSGPPPILTPETPAVGDLEPDPGTGGTNTNDGVFQFVVPANARAATVTVVSDGDVTLYGQKDSIPTTTTFTYRANGTLGPGTESLRIDQSSTPPLTPGIYYVRIANNTLQQVSYTATLTLEFDTTQVPFFVNIIRTSDGNLQLQGLNLTVGDTYAVEATNDLGAPNWITVTTRTAASPMETFAIPRDLAVRHRFFRLRKI